MSDGHFEIERKFLIRYPDLSWLNAAAEKSEISQTYLLSENPEWTERVRKRGIGGRFVYTHTTKFRLSAIRRVEREEEIGEEEYLRLLLRADPERKSIEKTRYCLRENGLLYEIDVFPFWSDRAFLEIELEDETQPFPWPEKLTCIREVTDDYRYTNSSMARQIPMEEIQDNRKEDIK